VKPIAANVFCEEKQNVGLFAYYLEGLLRTTALSEH